MKAARVLLICHLLAMAFGLAGLLIALPHPELWDWSPFLSRIFPFGLQHGGALHILFGAATMLALGFYAVGWRRTLVFFLVGTILPLAAELQGTATGWPFGGYSYTAYLGLKLGGRVPYSVPLSWFYMGFAAYLLASVIIARRGVRYRAVWSVLLGAWLLMAWDLVLDPALASPHMPLTFWVWHERGAYFGMPLRNLLGWFGTGLAFMSVSRLPWRDDPDPRRIPVWLPYTLYAANVVWAMALSLSVGLWPTALAATILALAPATLALERGKTGAAPEALPRAAKAREGLAAPVSGLPPDRL